MWMKAREREKCSPIYKLKNKDRFYHHYPIDSLNRNKPTDNFLLYSCSFCSFIKTNLTLPNRLKLNYIVCCRLTKSKKVLDCCVRNETRGIKSEWSVKWNTIKQKPIYIIDQIIKINVIVFLKENWSLLFSTDWSFPWYISTQRKTLNWSSCIFDTSYFWKLLNKF
jgi:hypothetical protein